MKCQQCGSDNLSVARGASYCLDCGRQHGQPNPGSEKLSVHPLRFSWGVAIGMGLLTGVIVAATIWFKLDDDTALYFLAGAGLATLVILLLGHAALLYGRSRAQDGRPAPHGVWWGVARSAFMDLVNVLLLAVISCCLLVGVGFGVWQLTSHYLSGVPEVLVLGVVNVALIWAFLGTYAALHLGVAAVVIGDVAAMPAVRIGWRLYRQAGGQAVAIVLENIFLRVVGGLALLMGLYLTVYWMSGRGDAAVTLACAGFAAYAIGVASFISVDAETKLWLSPYRRWVGELPAPERLRLLTGRTQRP